MPTFVSTSGSIAVGENSGRSARVIGMFTNENALTICGLPSSSSWKSPAFRSVTGLPAASLTKASTSTKFASTRKVKGGCSGC